MKKRLDIRIAEELRDGLDMIVVREGQTLTTIVERYIRDGIARDNGELIETNSLPEVRAAVREETAKVMTELYNKYETAMAKVALRDTNRLAALMSKAARWAGTGQGMIYTLLKETRGAQFADSAFASAKEKAGKELARPEGDGKS